jgi:energy-coupling factor transport system substrate-specific component
MRCAYVSVVGATIVALAASSVVAVALGAGFAPSTSYLLARQGDSGGFAEPRSAPTPGLTAWTVLALRAAGTPVARLESARAYLERTEAQLGGATDLQLALLARSALGQRPAALLAKVRSAGRGPTVSSAIWSVLALRSAGERPPAATVRAVLSAQRPSGGWSWARRGAPDSNDTAAAVQALRAVGLRGRRIDRALAFIGHLQNADGGFELTAGRGSDVQSTAWAVQAFVAAGRRPPRGSLRYLARMRRADGSYRYSARYATTPVWVTAQALLAVARRPLPLRPP